MIDGDCTTEILEQSIRSILEDNGHTYSRMLAQIPTRQKELLYAIASEGKADKVLGSAFIKRHSLQSASSVQAALKKLLTLDFITMEESYYTLPDRFMSLYIKLRQNPSMRLL